MDNLINWPRDPAVWHDTGEGGLFAFLVVLSEGLGEETNNCSVDVHVYLSEPDCRVPFRMAEPQLWDPADYHDRGRTRVHAARAALERHDEGEIAKSLLHLRGEDELSLPLRAAVLLGSTGLSLARNDGGGYFQVTRDDLTGDGEALYALMSKLYGTEPHLITFLDT